MVRHNNMISNGHFHKKWAPYVKTWFNQPFKKVRRNLLRNRKIKSKAPCPEEKLRPIVHCPSVRYNLKVRQGRGFTLKELKLANICRKYALTIGIAVDHRRQNKSIENMQKNVQRLKEYKTNLIIFPKSNKKAHAVKPMVIITTDLNKIKKKEWKLKAKVISEEDKKFQAFTTLRKARNEQKLIQRRLQRKKQTFENQEFAMKSGFQN